MWVDYSKYVGKTFNNLVFLRIDKSLPKRQDKLRAWCKCNLCGSVKDYQAVRVIQGRIWSCNCDFKNRYRASWFTKNKSYSDMEGMAYYKEFNHHRGKAKIAKKRKGVEFTLSFPEWKELVSKPCYYCGVVGADRRTFMKLDNITIRFNGIDRVDSSKGYTSDNSVSCCKYCNWAKNSQSIEHFKDHIVSIYKYWASKDSTPNFVVSDLEPPPQEGVESFESSESELDKDQISPAPKMTVAYKNEEVEAGS